jgi:hypothetical protein
MAKRKQQSIFKFPDSFHSLSSSFSKLFFKPTAEVIIDDQIVVIHKFFSTELCNDLIQSFSQIQLETTPLIKSKGYAARVNDRTLIEDINASRDLWDYLKQVLAQDDYDENIVRHTFADATSLNPQLRIYRYQKGHYFGKHYDESVKSLGGKTKWTLLIYLTGDDEFVGGGTIFHPDRPQKPLNVHPSKGMALLHKHGDDCLIHEAELVKSGVKWVLRSDVVF